MKKYIKPIIALSFIALFYGCSIDDIKPTHQLTDENAIYDEASAQRVLNGVYDMGREFDISFFPLHLAAYGDAGLINGFLSGEDGFNNNDVSVENPFLAKVYNGHYKVINSANFLMKQLKEGKAVGLSDEKRKEMIAQAKILRAINYFDLLRYFGEYYDVSSPNGVVLSTEFSTTLETPARSSVQDVYDLILDDIDYGIAHGASNIEHFYVGKVMAQALEAKVYLYMNDYTQAASLASEVINNDEGYSLEPDYPSIFTNSYDSSEVLFAPYHASGSEGGTQMDQIRNTTYSDGLRSLADAQVNGVDDGDLTGTGSNYDPRFSYAYSEVTQGVNTQGKYPFLSTANGEGNTLYHLRLAEVYLIYAEAEARRPGGDLSAALNRLNQIRTRAGVDPKTSTVKSELLENIRQEKLLELFFENGEPLFDLIRYGVLGDLNIQDIKPSLNQQYKYILPIPQKAIIGNNNLSQNSGY